MSDPDPSEAPEPDPALQGSGIELPPEDERRYPSTIGGAFYLGILTTAVVGLTLVVWRGDWRLGVRLMAVSLLVAAVLRLVLPDRDAGMLAVRHRAVDVAMLLVVGVALFLLVGSIPDQPF